MSAQHTPGPWQDCEPGGYGDYDGECIVVLGDDNMVRVAVVLGTSEESIVSAKLIATAPVLLAACKAQHLAIDLLMARLIALDPEFLPTKSNVWPAAVQGSEAIAKATGSAS